ncbi:MAG TPA: SRPBCC family protein [Miltoncostaeaceae bacterium]|nr:SRPBCC family protein [Miltoncostaeaceae bacterium]
MTRIEETVEVGVPVRTAYNQWTQFEEFPRFMEGVEEVRQLDDAHLNWRVQIGGRTHEYRAQITEQVPDRIIAWKATDGYDAAGSVRFAPDGPDRTKVTVVLAYEPEGAAEKVGSWLGFASRRVQNDLERFRDMIESRGAASGAWRGELVGGRPGGPDGARAETSYDANPWGGVRD